jgi:hypothetical protein
MNELFAADPAVCGHISDLKLLLASFGPYTGRYIANYPDDWSAQIEKQFEGLGDVEAAKAKLLLRRAKENIALVTRSNLNWCAEQGWLANAVPLLSRTAATPAIFDGLIAAQASPPAIHGLHEMDLPATAEERITGIAKEYARIAKMLLLLSPELALIDPYLDPLNSDCYSVLEAMFEIAAKGKSQKISLWARASEVIRYSTYAAIKPDLEDALRRLAHQANMKPGRVIEFVLVGEETKKTKMHGRYLLSIKGGIRLDQGFKQLNKSRQVDVGPIGSKATHDALLDIYFDGKHDMRIAERLLIKF